MKRPARSKLRVYIRPPAVGDRVAFLASLKGSRKLHRHWVSPPATSAAFKRFVNRSPSETHRGFLVLLVGTDELVGVINLNNIIRGAFRSAFLGYYAFA